MAGNHTSNVILGGTKKGTQKAFNLSLFWGDIDASVEKWRDLWTATRLSALVRGGPEGALATQNLRVIEQNLGGHKREQKEKYRGSLPNATFGQ